MPVFNFASEQRGGAGEVGSLTGAKEVVVLKSPPVCFNQNNEEREVWDIR